MNIFMVKLLIVNTINIKIYFYIFLLDFYIV